MNRRRKLWLIAGLIITVLFTVNYLAAWFQAYRLSRQYLQDAESAFNQKKYLEALTGFKEFDEKQGKYIQRGGYQQVEHIWSHPYAWPRPEVYERARERTQEIINQHLTIPMAEAFVQANIGKQAPYIGVVYLRLGELYEESGNRQSAIEIYRDVISLFPSQEDIVSKASNHLIRLGAAP